MINDVFDYLGDGFGRSLFSDDGAIWRRGRNVEYLIKKMQKALNKLQEWADKWGFRQSVAKCNYMIFGRKRTVVSKGLKLYGSPLEKVKVFKFLGGRRLSYRVHVDKMVSRCEKVVNIMRCLTDCPWGADRTAMLMIYKALVRPICEYACLAYGSAAKTNLSAKLDVVQDRVLRLCTGSFRTMRIPAQLVEAGETPLRLRREKLALNYWVKLKGLSSALPSSVLMSKCWESKKWQSRLNRGSVLESVGKYTEELGLEEAGVATCSTVAMG